MNAKEAHIKTLVAIDLGPRIDREIHDAISRGEFYVEVRAISDAKKTRLMDLGFELQDHPYQWTTICWGKP